MPDSHFKCRLAFWVELDPKILAREGSGQ